MRKKILFLLVALIIGSTFFFAKNSYANVQEKVKCVFQGSVSAQECHTMNTENSNSLYYGGGCGGTGSCGWVDTNGPDGTQITWGSSCGGSAYTVLDGVDETVTFNCTIPTYSIALNPSGTDGTIVSSPAGIICHVINGTKSGYCGASFSAGTAVTLTATPASGGVFTSWSTSTGDSGGCTGGSPTCTLTMNQNHQLGAVFSSAQPSITVLSPNGGETYKIGDTMNIRWSSKDLGTNTATIGIQLIDQNGTAIRGLAQGEANDGSFNWTIQNSSEVTEFVVKPGQYRVKVYFSSGVVPVASDSSDSYFTITASSTQPTTPNLTVTNFKYGNINDQNNVSTQVEFDLVNAGSSAATFYLVAWNDTTNYPLTSELKSLAANQTVHIYLMNVNNISHLALGLNAINIKEVSSDSQTVYNSQDFTVMREQKSDTQSDAQISQITTNANLLTNDKMSEILAELNQLRSIVKEQQTQIKYLSSLLKDVQGISAESQAVLNNFITYGVDANTVKLGAGERAAVVNSYKAAFDKLPQTEAELADVIKIANGRWPSITNQDAENQAKAQFLKIYKRAADMNGANDNAAVTIMAYGLRQKAENRNLNSEVNGIKIFKAIYGRTPNSTQDWNTMQAITYSGASR